jgi:hypothetical protein
MSNTGDSGQPAYGEPRFGEQPTGSDPQAQQPGYGQPYGQQPGAGAGGQQDGYGQPGGYGPGSYPSGAYPAGSYPAGSYPAGSYPAGGYGQPGYPVQQRTNVLAIVALVLGFVIPLGGVICGFVAKRQIRRSGENGNGLATAGIVIGFVFIALTVLAGVGLVVAVHHSNGTGGLVLLPH